MNKLRNQGLRVSLFCNVMMYLDQVPRLLIVVVNYYVDNDSLRESTVFLLSVIFA